MPPCFYVNGAPSAYVLQGALQPGGDAAHLTSRTPMCMPVVLHQLAGTGLQITMA